MKLLFSLGFFLMKISILNVSALMPNLHPENVTLYLGQNHTLKCSFDELVNCTWIANTIVVKINRRYQYVSNNGTSTTDCSIKITSVQKIDENNWGCSHQITGESDIDYHIMAKLAFVKVLHPKPIIMLNGSSVVHLLLTNETLTNATLSCIAGTSSTTYLEWEVDGMRILAENSAQDCNQSSDCRYTKNWLGGYEQLTNATNISCIAENEAITTVNITFTPQHTRIFKNKTDNNDTTTLDIEVIALIATGAFALTVVLVVSCICLIIYKCKNSRASRKVSSLKNPAFISTGSFHTSVNYYSTNTSYDGYREVFSSFKTPPPSIKSSSIVNLSTEHSEKGEICIMPETDNSAGGVIMLHYKSSTKGEREPCDSLYVNRCSILPSSKSVGTLKSSNIQSTPLPHRPCTSVRESSGGPTYSEIVESQTTKSKEELYDDCFSVCTDDDVWGKNPCYIQRLI